MIQTNDVRIDNWFRCNDLFIKVSGISKTSFTCTHKGLMYFNGEDVLPIEMSVDILEKIGFKINDDLGYTGGNSDSKIKVYSKDFFNISFNNGKFCYFFDNDDDYFYSFEWMEMKFVHQLQNTYYVISGKELEINL